MSFTRRTERVTFGRALPCTALALLSVAAPLSCGDDPARDEPNVLDAGPSQPDAGPSLEDAPADAPVDAPRLEVACTVTPCARDISASWSESFCALLEDGRVACWGRSASGELGRRDAGPWSATPALVDGVANAVALDRTCAVVAGGSVVCWGPAETPQWSDGAPPAARSVAVGDGFGCAVLTDGRVTCWGRSREDGVLAYAGAAPGESVPPTIVPLGGPVDEIAVARRTIVTPPDIFCPSCPPTITEEQAVLARRANGEVASWGLAPLIGRATEHRPDPNPGRVAVEGATRVFGGYGGCVASGVDLGCWGYGRDDRGGDLRPLPVPLVPDALDVTLGDYGSGRFGRGCAVAPAGAVYCWGENDYGQRGDGTVSFRDLPERVANLPEPIVRVQATALTTCALGVSGRVYCWGDDAFGQRGQKTPFTKDLRPLPVELP